MKKKQIFLVALLGLSLATAWAEDELPEIEDSINAEYTPDAQPEMIASANTTQPVPESKVLTAEPINVDGYVKEQAPPQDRELTEIKTEIERQKKEMVLNKAKTQSFKELSKSVEVLSETTEEMLEEKRGAKEQIADYNAKVKCLQQDNPGPECDKYVRRKR